MLDAQIQFTLAQESKTVCSLADVVSFATIVENREKRRVVSVAILHNH